jgi:hypothetical protein
MELLANCHVSHESVGATDHFGSRPISQPFNSSGQRRRMQRFSAVQGCKVAASKGLRRSLSSAFTTAAFGAPNKPTQFGLKAYDGS